MLAAILALVLFVNVGLGFQVFSYAPNRSENRAFAVFTWLMALWIVNDLVFWGFHGLNEDGRLWAQTALFLALAIQLAFLWFAWVFPKNREIPWRRMSWAGIPILMGLMLIFSGQAMGEAGYQKGQFRLETTPATYFVGALIYGLFFLGRWLLYRSRQKVTDIQLGFQLDTLALAAWTTGGITNIVGVLMPLLGVYGLLPYFSVGILLGCLIHAYAILNFRLFQPASLLDRLRLFPVTAKLSITISAVCFATVLIVLTIARLVIGPGDWKRAVVFGLIGSSVPAMILISVVQVIVTRPLRTITEAALRVAKGETDVRVQVGARDEVAVLANTFNNMVQRLEHDLEQMQVMSEGLLQSERLATAGALAAGIAHEVNNPLAAVSSLVQIVQARAEHDEDKQRLEQALEQTDRVAAVLKALMGFARPKQERRAATSLNEVIDKTVRLLGYDKRLKKTPIKVMKNVAMPVIEADADRIQQVLMNLILNAYHAVSDAENGEIVIETQRLKKDLLIQVKDNGAGIPEEQQARIFEPFFSTKAPDAGTGLGLAVCRDIIHAHQGRLKVTNRQTGGACFTIILPILSEWALR